MQLGDIITKVFYIKEAEFRLRRNGKIVDSFNLYISKLKKGYIEDGQVIENVDEVIDKIFVPFYTTRENGSGIGLSFARQVMVMHNGYIEVNSKPNLSTTFSLYF